MQLFVCPSIPGKLTLSAQSCANYHVSAQKKEWALRLRHCVECPVGAKNAGVDLAAPFQRREVCLRCGSGRGRMVFARLCMSCYNRESEWKKGRNAKGRQPREYKPLVRFFFTRSANGHRYSVEAASVCEAFLIGQKVWGITDLVMDPRPPMLSRQITIFEEGRVVHAPGPCSNSPSYRIVANGWPS
jgi:hypothetical protein